MTTEPNQTMPRLRRLLQRLRVREESSSSSSQKDVLYKPHRNQHTPVTKRKTVKHGVRQGKSVESESSDGSRSLPEVGNGPFIITDLQKCSTWTNNDDMSNNGASTSSQPRKKRPNWAQLPYKPWPSTEIRFGEEQTEGYPVSVTDTETVEFGCETTTFFHDLIFQKDDENHNEDILDPSDEERGASDEKRVTSESEYSDSTILSEHHGATRQHIEKVINMLENGSPTPDFRSPDTCKGMGSDSQAPNDSLWSILDTDADSLDDLLGECSVDSPSQSVDFGCETNTFFHDLIFQKDEENHQQDVLEPSDEERGASDKKRVTSEMDSKDSTNLSEHHGATKQDIEKVINMLEKGSPPPGFKLFGAAKKTRRSTPVSEYDLLSIDSFVEICAARNQIQEEDDEQGTGILRSYIVGDARDPITDAEREGRETNYAGFTEERSDISTADDTNNDETVDETREDRFSEDIGRGEYFPPAKRSEPKAATATTGKSNANAFVQSEELASIEETCYTSLSESDSWGRGRFQNLSPIARIRLKNQGMSNETCPYYY
jgi:hypothetical protein